ncbi:MAG TPA: XRE family transcriptional regulator [Symbiobacteriaceae bacterium]
MEPLNMVIAQNLRRLREAKKLSLDRVAEVTGVSKSMLGQIERGESNPTVATVWKIAGGLKVSFTALINSPQPDTVVIERNGVEPLVEDAGRYRIYPFFPYEEGRPFEMYTVEMARGSYLSADAHGAGTQEFITVFEGELTLRVGAEEFTVGTGDSIRFKADCTHAYHNSGAGVTRLCMVIHYQS